MPTHPRRRPMASCSLVLALFAATLAATATATAADERNGEQVYKATCVRCHGATGEGSAEAKRTLAGDKSVDHLTQVITETMPEDDPGSCSSEDARKVAAYIHDAFYSPTARERNKPARIEVSRLTVRQYRNAVADLIGTFRGPIAWDDQRGVHGEYFDARGFRNDKRVIDRRDPVVRFDFGDKTPDPAKFKGDDFTIRWEGSVLAPDTGEYEFIVRTEHALRLFVNDTRMPLIDAWVKSGNDTEFRAPIRFLGGRAYALRIEFSKAKQGVDDSKTKKTKPPAVKASIALLWKPPQRVEDVIPERNLSPVRSPETFVVETPFPPDDRSVGYERGTSVSKAWDQATTDAAIETAGYVAAHLRELSNVSEEARDREKRLREFSRKFAERAFRRPLTDDQVGFFIDRSFKESKDPVTAVKRVVLLTLKSPRFLYREISGPRPDGYEVASRLSFGLWDSLPDTTLLAAAASGRLGTREQVAAQADRMVGDLRTRSKVREFLLQWLRVDQAPDVSKDPKLFPGFTPAVVSDLRTSLDLFLDRVVWGESSDFRQLLLADSYDLNGRLAKFYGVDLPADAPFKPVKMEPERAGLLTHPYLMATFAYTATSSPIHRGVFIARGVLGRAIRTPPIAVAPLAPDLHAGMTTRERITLQTSPAVCQSCHSMINPLGFPLERFDAVGRFRSQEQGKPVDASGKYESLTGQSVTFNGARDYATFLAGSEETHTSFVEQLFHYLVKQPVRAYGPNELPGLRQSFASSGFHIRKLLVEIMATSALTPRDAKPQVAQSR
jgi:cytochrome c5